jgi:flagellin
VSFYINTNIASLQAQTYLNQTNNSLNQTIQEVTSGLRIVNSGDDAAGLAVANQYRSNEAVLTQGIQNATDGLNQLQIADGGISNISQLLDRASTLATESASGTFTGNRSTLNAEFQSVIGEINRQAQSIGLNTGGTFAKNLSVFIGGGQASNGISAAQNGSISLNLGTATVDAQSLGLTGVQAIGVAGTDIGAGSANTSLSAILANTANTATEATPGYTAFKLVGPGFGGNGVTISVNTANLGGTSDLVSALNAAISAAANGGTQQDTALKNADITASISTDSTGKQQLAFSSSNAAFQVVAGDQVANALLGNFAQNAAAVSSDTNPYVNTSTNDSLTISIDGTSLGAINVTSGPSTSKGQIADDLNANSAFNQVATAYLQGNQLVIQSKNTGSTSAVQVTGALATSLGFSSTASTAGSASTGASLNVQVQGAGVVAAGANAIGSDAGATATIGATNDKLYLTVGSSGAQTLTLTNGTDLTKQDIANDINTQIANNGNFTGANAVTASVVNNQIVLTAAAAGSNVVIAGGANNVNSTLGFTAATYSNHTATTSDNITLQFTGGGLTSPVDVSLPATTASTTTSADALANLQTAIASNSSLQAAGITLSTAAVGNNLVFTDSNGQQFQVAATGDSTNLLGLGSFASGADGAVNYTSITAGSAYSTSGSAGTATFQVSLGGNASSANTFSANLSGGDATSAATTGTAVLTGAADSLAGSAGPAAAIVIRVDGGASQSITLGNSATETATQILTAINSGLNGATASLNSSGHLVITSNSKGADSSIEIGSASDAGLLTALGLTASSVSNGTNASETNVLQQLNNSIASNSTLVAAGIQAVDNGGSIEIKSSNGTDFRLASTGSGNVGFGNYGTTFTGNAQGAAPATSPYFNSQGANATSALAYTPTLYGSDGQTVNITAIDSEGTKHSLSVALNQSNSQSIDQALNAINTALQQSNDSTLDQIVAVKGDSSGSQNIQFLSTVPGFQVTVSSDPNGTGITPPTGNTTNASIAGTGSTAEIADIGGATSAVTALANAVQILGAAQAVVGRGENQFNYAINLAQSQLTNESAAEASIRDADLASASADLTKGQIQLQAGIAALAQANSAPQQILKLLQ